MSASDYKDFSDFLTKKRKDKKISLRQLSRYLKVSATYLSEVENNKSAPLTYERLQKVATFLNLSDEEQSEMYDLAGNQRGTVAPDLLEYIKKRDYVNLAIRTARDMGASEDDWLNFIEELKRKVDIK
jgi:transcriptional regulator with XRE-family HTH domain